MDAVAAFSKEARPGPPAARIAEGQLLRGGEVGAAGFSVSTSRTNIPPHSAGERSHDQVRAAVRAAADRDETERPVQCAQGVWCGA